MRWRLKLKDDYTIIYKTDNTNKNADVLSRNPINKIAYLSANPVQKRPRFHLGTATFLESSDEPDDESRRKTSASRRRSVNVGNLAEETDSAEETSSIPRIFLSAGSSEKQNNEELNLPNSADGQDTKPEQGISRLTKTYAETSYALSEPRSESTLENLENSFELPNSSEDDPGWSSEEERASCTPVTKNKIINST